MEREGKKERDGQGKRKKSTIRQTLGLFHQQGSPNSLLIFSPLSPEFTYPDWQDSKSDECVYHTEKRKNVEEARGEHNEKQGKQRAVTRQWDREDEAIYIGAYYKQIRDR